MYHQAKFSGDTYCNWKHQAEYLKSVVHGPIHAWDIMRLSGSIHENRCESQTYWDGTEILTFRSHSVVVKLPCSCWRQTLCQVKPNSQVISVLCTCSITPQQHLQNVLSLLCDCSSIDCSTCSKFFLFLHVQILSSPTSDSNSQILFPFVDRKQAELPISSWRIST